MKISTATKEMINSSNFEIFSLAEGDDAKQLKSFRERFLDNKATNEECIAMLNKFGYMTTNLSAVKIKTKGVKISQLS